MPEIFFPENPYLLNSNKSVPMLQYGTANTFDTFNRKMIVACLEKYKRLGHFIEEDIYYLPPPVDDSGSDPNNDCFGFQ